MSNLSSDFTVVAGLPPHDFSALRRDITVKAALGYTLPAGTIVATESTGAALYNEVIDKATSAPVDVSEQCDDHFWVVIRGNDQGDGSISNTCTCVKLNTGVAFQVDTLVAFTIGDYCRANAGAIAALTAAKEQALGVVIGVNAANGTVIVAS